MTEFLVRIEGESRYIRVIAQTVSEIAATLETDAPFTAFSTGRVTSVSTCSGAMPGASV